jgi:hypothetical protein
VESYPPAAPAGSPEAKSKSPTWMFVLAGVLIVALCLVIGGIGILSSGGLTSLGSFQPTPTDQQLFDVLHKNAKAGVNEDLDAYMATIHTGSPLYGRTEDTLKEMFATYDLNFEFYDLTVTSLKTNEAKVHFSLLTRKRTGPDFRNNIVIGTMILRPDNGVWKIYNQTVEDVQY